MRSGGEPSPSHSVQPARSTPTSVLDPKQVNEPVAMKSSAPTERPPRSDPIPVRDLLEHTVRSKTAGIMIGVGVFDIRREDELIVAVIVEIDEDRPARSSGPEVCLRHETVSTKKKHVIRRPGRTADPVRVVGSIAEGADHEVETSIAVHVTPGRSVTVHPGERLH